MRPSLTKISIVLVFIFCCMVAVAIYFNYDNKKFSAYAECDMQDGPIMGRKIPQPLLDQEVNANFTIPGGRILISNTGSEDLEQDKTPPILYKVDSNYRVIWAIELSSNNEIPLYSIEDCRMFNHELHFFNSTHFEPGVIYFDENYDFKYMCLSMF